MPITEQDIRLFHASLQRCTGRSGFMDRFYSLLLASSKEVADKLKGTSTERQKMMLHASLYLMIFVADGRPESYAHLERIARRHSRSELDIRPELYDLWLDCLIQAVKESDPFFSMEIERVWQTIMRQGIEFMKSRY